MEGDPKLNTDQNAFLLYNSHPPTSFATVRIDGEDFIFGDDSSSLFQKGPGKFVDKMHKQGDALVCSWQLGKIIIIQKLGFIIGPTTGNQDTISIAYTVINQDKIKHSVGIRIMLDTYLGKEDGADFRIPGIGPLKAEISFDRDNVPHYWYSYDDLVKPSVRAQGTLKIRDYPLPDKVIFACCVRLLNYIWDYSIEQGRSFKRSKTEDKDTGVALYWNPRYIESGEEYTIKTYYGLYGASIYEGEVFNISISGPAKITSEPFCINADIQNTSVFQAKDLKARIILLKGLALFNNDTEIKNIGVLAPNDISRSSWNVIQDQNSEDNLPYKVEIIGQVKKHEKKSMARISETIPEQKITVAEKIPQKNPLLLKKPGTTNSKEATVIEKTKEQSVIQAIQTTIKSNQDLILISTNKMREYRIQKVNYGIVVQFDLLLFDFKKAVLSEELIEALDKIIEFLQRYEIANMIIYGHTDNVGCQGANLNLSQQRADNVHNYFLSHGAFKKVNIITKGLGETRPIALNTTREGRQKNRRVEIIIIGLLK